MKKMPVGIIGCGYISAVYCRALQTFGNVQLKACADIRPEAAEHRAREFGIRAVSPEGLLGDDEIELVINLTNPAAHYAVNRSILAAGKHLYSEKPLALSLGDGRHLHDLASDRGRSIGSAPDTFLGGAHQTALKLVREGAIGRVTSGSAHTMFSGPEKIHPAPSFFYEAGGGPVLDMSPYHLTHLASFLGPIAGVRACSTSTWPVRRVRVGPASGQTFKSAVPTHTTGILEFESGAIVTLTASFDVWRHTHPHLELYGTEGSLSAPDPDYFGGEVRVSKRGEPFEAVPLAFGHADGNFRGIGVAEMIDSLHSKRQHRANGDLAFHVLEVMLAMNQSTDMSRRVEITSRFPVVPSLEPGAIAYE
jgi:predicted dehydrogenase